MRFGLKSLLFLGCQLVPGMVSAHAQYRPFSINRYTVISFGDEEIRISYTVTVGDLPAQKLRIRADQDGDGVLSDEECKPLGKWMRELVFSGISVKLDGQVGELSRVEEQIDLVSKQTKLFAPMRFAFEYSLPCRAGRHELIYYDTSRMPTLEQTEFFVRENPGVQLGGLFHLRTTRRAERRIFWERGELPGPVAVRFSLSADAQASGADRAVGRLVDDSGPLKRALADERLGFFGMLAALGLALLLGALHALAPGHGKALVAAYLVGSRGKMRHAAILGLIVTFTHIFSVVILGLIALWATEQVVPERLAPWLALASGLLVAGLGVWMLVSRIRNRGHHHHHEHGAGEVRWSELLLLGLSGGMVPCVSATVVLLFAVYLGRIVFGLLLIAAFSLGLALTLIVLGILVVRGRMLLGRLSSGRVSRVMKLLPVASAGIVTALGVVMVIMALPGL